MFLKPYLIHPEDLLLVELELEENCEEEDRNSTASAGFLLRLLTPAGLTRKPLYSAMRKEKLLVSRAL